MRFKLLLLSVLANLLVASNFLVSNDFSDSNTNISFNLGEYSFEEKDGYKQILTTSKGKIDRYGEPDLPQFSFNFAIENTLVLLSISSSNKTFLNFPSELKIHM